MAEVVVLEGVSKFLCVAACSQNGWMCPSEEKPQPCSSLLRLGLQNWQQKFSFGFWVCKLPSFLGWRGGSGTCSCPSCCLECVWGAEAPEWVCDISQHWAVCFELEKQACLIFVGQVSQTVASLSIKAVLAMLTWTWKSICLFGFYMHGVDNQNGSLLPKKMFIYETKLLWSDFL